LEVQTTFQREDERALTFEDDQFDLVLDNASLTLIGELKSRLAEIVRVARPGGTIGWWLPTFSSFGEFFSIYWEALLNAGLEDHGVDVEQMITALPTISDAETWAAENGLTDIASWTAIEEFDYESGEQFLNSPLIMDFLLRKCLDPIPEKVGQRVREEPGPIINE